LKKNRRALMSIPTALTDISTAASSTTVGGFGPRWTP
jgi:hypothetical protein